MGKTIDTDELKKKFEPRQAYFTEGIFRKIDEPPPVAQVTEAPKAADTKPRASIKRPIADGTKYSAVTPETGNID